MPADVTFYIGRAGTGKTSAVYGRLKAAMQQNKRAVLIVPEQYTYEAERALTKELNGLLGVQVLSMTRLGERAVAAQARPFLNAEGRRMVVRREAGRLHASFLYFGASALRPGFAKRMDEVITRLKQARMAPGTLKEAAQRMDAANPLRDKLHDIALLYGAVQAYLDDNYIDSDDAQNALLHALPRSFLRDAEVCFDGFAHVNEQLYAILTGVMTVAKSVAFTICASLDSAHRDYGLFAPERQVYTRLSEEAHALGCRVFVNELKGETGPSYSPFRFMERELFAVPHEVYKQGTNGAVSVFGAGDRVQEVDAMADALLMRAREGVRFRDMAVLCSDLDGYAPLVRRAFSLRDIPCFEDARRSMQGHPVVELMLAALRAVTHGFYRAELLRMVKTGLADVEADDASQFENYCLRRNFIGGKVFLAPFPETEEVPERVRIALITPLTVLREGLRNEGTAGGKAQAVYRYLAELRVEAKLREETERLRAEGRFALMEEHAQVYGILMEMLEQLHGILGEAPMSGSAFIEVLNEGLKAYQVGIIPATADQVLLGDMQRTRSSRVEALFLLGCNEGLMPAPRLDDDIIDDAELFALKELGLCLWAGAREYALNDQFAIYRTLSKVRGSLWLGFSYTGNRKELLPALIADRIRTLFPDVTEERENSILLQSERSAFSYLIRNIGEDNVRVASLKRYFSAHSQFGEAYSTVCSFASSAATPEFLTAYAARALYGSRYCGSVSRLQTFRTCPYKHFLAHGLRIRIRREGKGKKADVGSFAHMALEKLVKTALVQEKPLREWTREDTDKALDGILPVCLQEYENGLFLHSPRERVLSAAYEASVRETAWAIVKSIRAGSFAPIMAEAHFAEGGELPPLRVGNNAVLSGVIDRVDIAQGEDGRQYVRVVDYKTGELKLHFADIEDGRALQLPLYLIAALQNGARPGGMYYQPVKTPVPDEGEEEKAEKMLYLNGLLTDEDRHLFATERAFSGKSAVVHGLSRSRDGAFYKNAPVVCDRDMERLLHYAVKRAGEIAEEILCGQIAGRPVKTGGRTACEYCDYSSVCRFDTRLTDCRPRRPKMRSREEFLTECLGTGQNE